MTLEEKIKKDLTEALKAKDTLRLTVLRSVVAGFTNELVAQKRKPDERVEDEIALAVLNRALKQRKDSIEQFEKGGRSDLAQNEEKERAIIEQYLPELMGRTEIEQIAKTKKEELGISDPSKKGVLMGTLMKDLKGKADGKMVKDVVDALFT